jgi:hypothetical protein
MPPHPLQPRCDPTMVLRRDRALYLFTAGSTQRLKQSFAMGVTATTSPSFPNLIASRWLDRFSAALDHPDPARALARLLSPDAYLRDHLLLSWDLRTLHGIENISPYVTAGLAADSNALGAGGLSKIKLDERDGLAPELLSGIDQPGAVQLSWTFESARARGRGSARLLPPFQNAPADSWCAGSVFFMLDAIKGHEERGFELGLYGEGGVRIPWEQINRERREKVERDPYVVIGALLLPYIKMCAHCL